MPLSLWFLTSLKYNYPVNCKSATPAFVGGCGVLMVTTVFYQPFGHLEEVPKIKERKVVGYKCKFCVEVHPTLRAICNHLRKHVQYGNVPSVSAAVKVRRGRSRYLACMCTNICVCAMCASTCAYLRYLLTHHLKCWAECGLGCRCS